MRRRRLIFPWGYPQSIVRAEELNFRVREGNGWTLFAVVTGSPAQTGGFFTGHILPCLQTAVNSFLDEFEGLCLHSPGFLKVRQLSNSRLAKMTVIGVLLMKKYGIITTTPNDVFLVSYQF